MVCSVIWMGRPIMPDDEPPLAMLVKLGGLKDRPGISLMLARAVSTNSCDETPGLSVTRKLACSGVPRPPMVASTESTVPSPMRRASTFCA